MMAKAADSKQQAAGTADDGTRDTGTEPATEPVAVAESSLPAGPSREERQIETVARALGCWGASLLRGVYPCPLAFDLATRIEGAVRRELREALAEAQQEAA